MKIGYNKPLYILAFDHRASFAKLINAEGEPNDEQINKIKYFKQLIFKGFKAAVGATGIPKESAAILVDEHYGDEILTEASGAGFITCMPAEKSGQQEFELEYGDEFGKHIDKYKPTFVKVLVRYNPEGDKAANKRQTEKLKKLSEYCHEHDYPFLFELLVPATDDQLSAVEQDKERYDLEIRPRLMTETVKEMQTSGVEVDVWKVEGLDKADDYQALMNQIRSNGRNEVGMVVLGRGADDAKVEHWLREAKKIEGITGFAVGRTIFADALIGFRDKVLSEEEVIEKIAYNYMNFYKVFNE